MSLTVDRLPSSPDRMTGAAWVPGSTPGLSLTFDVRAGGLRRHVADQMAEDMTALGLDVCWTDTRAGWFGVERRFTIRGPRATVQHVIADIGSTLGWQPGFVALPG
jgi:hypothetical protein